MRKKNGAYLVRWRENGRERSKQFREIADAEALKEQLNSEALARDVLANTPGIPGWDDDGPLPAADDRYAFTTYATQIIDADADLRDTTRALYVRNLRLHVAGTAMGQADIRSLTPDDVREWWSSLKVGVGARRNAQQLVAKVFNRAVLVGDLDVSPLKRAPEVKRPSAQRREEYEPLTVAEVEGLAESATQPRRGQVGPKAEMARRRDRLEILLMAYAGLRAGELGGLRVTDLVRHGDRCQLRLRQQVVRQTGRPAYTSPLKTKAARRTVPVPCSVS
jgi:integrase